jgi:hypothetical protein
MNKNLFMLAMLVPLASCATITTGTSQSVNVVTLNTEGADCKLTDSKSGAWYVKDTPATATVRKGDGPMTITCSKDGFKKGTSTVDEELVGATFGNIILGGGIGIAVDAFSGAAQKYPPEFQVWMEPEQFKNSDEKKKYELAKVEYDAKLEKKKEEAKSSNKVSKKKK